MAVYLSPGVFPREIDLSAVPNAGSGIIPAFIGTAQKGPVGIPTYVTSGADFIEKFGNQFVDSNLGYAVLTYMEEGSGAWIMRVGVECATGQVDALASICIDTSGAMGDGWGRIALFSGIDYGRIVLRTPSTDSPYVFHNSSVSTAEFTDIDVSSTDGVTDAALTFSGEYFGAIDDFYTLLVTSPPTAGEMIDGARIEVTRQSDGVVVVDEVVSATGGTSDSIELGTGDDASGLAFVITVTGSSPLEQDDTFTWTVQPDNRSFQVEVEGSDVEGVVTMAATTYTDPEVFVTDLNALLSGSADWSAVSVDGVVELRTDTAGERIQLVGNVGDSDPTGSGTEAWCLEVGTTKWTYDIPRSHLIGANAGPYAITTQNDRLNFLNIASDVETSIEFTLSTSLTMPIETLAAQVHNGGIKAGTRYFEAFAIQADDADKKLVVVTTNTNQFDQIKLVADFSHPESIRFADTVEISYPYTLAYRSYSDTRVLEPASGVDDPTIPLSCEDDPSGSNCTEDTAFYENVVGFLVAKSAGTWIDAYTTTLQNYNNEAGRYSLIINDAFGNVVERIDDVSFDSEETRYIANVINPDSSIGGKNGNSWLMWIERDSDIGAGEVRLPATRSTIAFTGAANGIPADAGYSSYLDAAIIGNQALNTGLYAFDNPETVDISLLAVPGNSSGSVIGTALQICERRGDCLFIVDPPFGLKPQQVVDWHNGMLAASDVSSAINSSYGALYWGWVKLFDQVSAQEIFVPPSGHAAQVFARTERERESWYAPAGLNRGRLLTALDVEYVPSRGDRDLLYGYNNAVNPITKFPQDGIVIWGQRTLQRQDTALDRINVRMLLIHVKKVLIPLLRFYLFEQNDKFLWGAVVNAVDPVLADIAGRRGLTAYKVICDESNNTPATIDRNELHVTVMVRPTRVAEFIQLDLAILRSDQLFSSEAVLRAAGVVGI